MLKEPGRSSASKSYMWLYRTSGCAKQAVVLYEYRPTRKAEHAEAFLQGFNGWLHADGYQGYHKLPGNIRVVGCWAHARRKFDEALQTLPKEMQKDSPAAIGECYCSRLFKLEQAFAELTPEERYEKRLEQAKPVLDVLLSWANEMQMKTAPKSALGRAIHYLLEQWPYLTRYLEDGRLELRNNRAERSIKPFVMGRKNWLFANTPGGAQASAVIYSLIETAKEPALLSGSFASAEAVAHIMTQKFVMYSPLYRLQQEFERQGLKLSRQTMANWLLNTSEKWLRPVYDTLREQLRKESVLHADELCGSSHNSSYEKQNIMRSRCA